MFLKILEKIEKVENRCFKDWNHKFVFPAPNDTNPSYAAAWIHTDLYLLPYFVT